MNHQPCSVEVGGYCCCIYRLRVYCCQKDICRSSWRGIKESDRLFCDVSVVEQWKAQVILSTSTYYKQRTIAAKQQASTAALARRETQQRQQRQQNWQRPEGSSGVLQFLQVVRMHTGQIASAGTRDCRVPDAACVCTCSLVWFGLVCVLCFVFCDCVFWCFHVSCKHFSPEIVMMV
ncbi:uncharacterized protein ASCRUDRAFT_108474 [Ascoidea rubescens DSM 1968]|uniref:Uncharacterized protein n=1 Tax=Ascoidea rubescens DSM 1968 TaxID=1344418 RepID=A0A1D2VE99_9ASCO|nr:hypothetical protein ASCRUDRAFT_108401 [Ascoidea rubescens DSM 1968]XP_020046263.1 hypothetical protein ASCRUDRAFT_108474 [Ascoidea rubescens DSM 1968]ODV59940.1 hypothetical protein ASCRUDRAFT_108401 [Ascoidea rubescens DSM 1968]ODV59956.1 hypothetical protein ASCRUDRAFT_108474 [Ascoidea rubescens DSM 1968]